MNRSNSTGYYYAFGASFALAASFIFSKSVLNKISLIQFGFIWFSMGILWNSIWFILKKDYLELKGSFNKKLGIALVVALIEGIATGLFYIAIKKMENPAVVSFIGNIGPVFVTILGITILKERFNRFQLAGIIITILGVFFINYRIGGFTGFLERGSMYIVLASLFFAIATILGRAFSNLLVPGFMSLLRSGILAVSFLLMLILTGQSVPFDITSWRDMILGSLLETLITIVFAYQALKYIEATRTSLIISSRSVWTLFLAWIFLDVFPVQYQIIGGILTLLGVWLITLNRSPFRK